MGEKRLSFTFEKCLALGGFGEVYVATMGHPGGPRRRVAVKVLKEDLQNTTEAVQRLRDEGRMLSILDHPAIVRVLEMTLLNGRVALVTEYLEGIDLARCCKPNTRLPDRVVLQAIGEVASALHCAWTTLSPETGKPLQLIHRDIKPDNLRIGKDGSVKVLDFGIARTTEMYRHAKTKQGDLPFTPGYAPPEAFTRGFQGSASDVYALGVTLYRLLTAQRLYEGHDLAGQVAIACLQERYDPFLEQRLERLEAGQGVRALLQQMLAYDPASRPSAEQVHARCQALAEKVDGPELVRWARAMTFPPPKALEGGTLTGQTVEEDGFDRPTKRRLNPRELHKRRANRQKKGLLGAASGSSEEREAVPTPRVAPDAPLPPPVPETVAASTFEPAPPRSAPPAPKKPANLQTLDAFMVDGPPEAPTNLKSLTPAPAPRQAAPQVVPVPEEPTWSASMIVLVLIALMFIGLGTLIGVGFVLGLIVSSL